MKFLRSLWVRLTCTHFYVVDPEQGMPTMWARCVFCKKPKRL